MRDREAINRFCAFHLLGQTKYRDDMDQFLGESLTQMNRSSNQDIDGIKTLFLRSMRNNVTVFGKHAFRKHRRDQESRGILNMSLFDVFSTGLARYDESVVYKHKTDVLDGFFALLQSDEFQKDITYGTNGKARVLGRFQATNKMIQEALNAD